MNNRLAQASKLIAAEFARFSAWLAGFSAWRLLGLSLLLLIASSLVGDLLFGGESSAGVSINRPAAETAAEGVPGSASGPCVEDVQVDLRGVQVRKNCGDEVARDRMSEGDSPVEQDTPETTAVLQADLSEWMLAFLAILWVIWYAGRARHQAEVTADRAVFGRQIAEARLQALQAQVEPHFLFNTLGAVEHLIETDPPRAATMQRHLIAFLRGAMPRLRGEAVTLGEEVALCQNYLAIMRIRMEDRLDFRIDVPAHLASRPFPPMLLQPLVENAIKHGLEPKPEGGTVMLSARAASGRLRVAVADSGLGFSPGTAATAGTGIGLANIRERLWGLYGERAALIVSPNAPTGAQVVIEIPDDNADGHPR